jgi:alginate O-acetyltransferase complex protein AlgI
MNFAQLEYPVFLVIVVLVVALLRSLLARKVVVLVASLYFYAYWDYRFLGLLVGSTLLDFTIGLGLEKANRQGLRRCLLGLSLAGNLGVLGFFKYYNFFVESAQPIVERWGLHPGTLSIVLPIGISFYTFQTLSYSIDVYRRQLKACRSWLDFAIYVCFFPQLVAGPIVRAREFLPQLRTSPRVQAVNVYPAFAQILRGFVKKVLIADHLAALVDPVFAAPHLFHGATVALAALAYAGQIYGDFSGYSDIAIGSARLLGFSLPANFRHPYLASSISDFWRRWHMTLSRWLRDYLYIPLGGNRLGHTRTYLNLMITMALGGLWHGAAWNFVAWGIWHGMALSVDRAFFKNGTSRGDRTPSLLRRGLLRRGLLRRGLLRQWAGVSTTFLIVLVGWVMFRSASVADFIRFGESITNWSTGVLWLPPFPLMALALLIAEHLLWSTRFRSVLSLDPNRWHTPWVVGFLLAALALFAPSQAHPFVYFQF